MTDLRSTNHRISQPAMLVSDHNAGSGKYHPKMYGRSWSYDVIGDYDRRDGVMGDDGRSGGDSGRRHGVTGDCGRSDGDLGDDGRSGDVLGVPGGVTGDCGRSDGVMGGDGRGGRVRSDSGRREGVMSDCGRGDGEYVRSAYSWRRHEYVMAVEGVYVGESADGVIGDGVIGDGMIGDTGNNNKDAVDEEVQVSSEPHKKGKLYMVRK